MNKIIRRMGLGAILVKRDLFRLLQKAKDHKGTSFGNHILEKARTERNAATFLSDKDLAEIDKNISEVAKLFTPTVHN